MVRIYYAVGLLMLMTACQTTGVQHSTSGDDDRPEGWRSVPAMREDIFYKISAIQDELANAEGEAGAEFSSAIEKLVVLESYCWNDCNAYEQAVVANHLAYAHFRKSDLAAASRYLNNLLLNSSQIPQGMEMNALYFAAQVSYQLDRISEAARYLDRLSQLRHTQPLDEMWLRAQVASDQGEHEKSLELVDKVIDKYELLGTDALAETKHYELKLAALSALGREADKAAVQITLQKSHMHMREAVPLSKVAPVYPLQAMKNGIEGHCMVEFDVGVDGTTQNVHPVACSDAVFESTSVRAASQFRYYPKLVGGEPVVAEGVRNKFTFEIDKSDSGE